MLGFFARMWVTGALGKNHSLKPEASAPGARRFVRSPLSRSHVNMYVRMYGWMEGKMDGWKDGRCMDARMHGCMDVWMDGWMDGWTDGWMDAYHLYIHLFVICIYVIRSFRYSVRIHSQAYHTRPSQITQDHAMPDTRPDHNTHHTHQTRLYQTMPCHAMPCRDWHRYICDHTCM